jgi:hypothetical protein
MAPTSSLRIDARFQGPPRSANGGYACGSVAAWIDGPARVRLHAPPPLDRALAVAIEDGEVRVLDGEQLVATGRPESPMLDVPPPPSLEAARRAATHYVGGTNHPFATCFVCGPQRAHGDGLCIFPGAVGDGTVAATFDVPADLVDAEGLLLPEIVWAALDCPGYYAVTGDRMQPMVLGELCAELRAPARVSGPMIAYAWPRGGEGKKAHCGSALATAEGEVIAVARGTWIRLSAEQAEKARR